MKINYKLIKDIDLFQYGKYAYYLNEYFWNNSSLLYCFNTDLVDDFKALCKKHSYIFFLDLKVIDNKSFQKLILFDPTDKRGFDLIDQLNGRIILRNLVT